MCGESVICVDSCVFDNMILEMKQTRIQLMLSLARSEDILNKLYVLRDTSLDLPVCTTHDILNNIIDDK